MSIARSLVLAAVIGCGGGGPPPQAIPDDDPPQDPVTDPHGRGWHCAPSTAQCYRDAGECRGWDEACERAHVAYCVQLPSEIDCYTEPSGCDANRPDGTECFETP